MTPETVRTRLAPTPSGYLHIGNVFSFLLTWLLAKAGNGTVLLRIDDLDAARVRPEYVEDIFATLAWLGLVPDEGPSGPGDFARHWSQHNRLHLYNHWLDQLRQQGHVYACTCSRAQVLQQNADGVYRGHCKSLHISLDSCGAAWRVGAKRPAALSIFDHYTRTERQLNPFDTLGDWVVRKKDGLPAYQVASAADDRHFGITMVVRGEDLWPSTAAQWYLAACCGYTFFENIRFFHHPLLRNQHNEKLSKSAGDTSLQYLRQQGLQLPELLQSFSRYAGLGETRCENLMQLLEHFAACKAN